MKKGGSFEPPSPTGKQDLKAGDARGREREFETVLLRRRRKA
jgi:hypothetical protein